MSDTIPTYGYRPGEAKIFDLKPGEGLPEGWRDTPHPEPELVEPDAPKKRKSKALE